MRRPASDLARGFTLIELLVVLAIVGILTAILLPVLGRARENASATTCQSNLHQIGLSVAQYVSDNGGRYLPVSVEETVCREEDVPGCPRCVTADFFWGKALLPYARGGDVFVCPSSEGAALSLSESGGSVVWDSCPPPPGGGGGGGGSGPSCPKIELPPGVGGTYAFNAMVPHAQAWAHSPGANTKGQGFDRSAVEVTCRVMRVARSPIRDSRVEAPGSTIMVVDSALESGESSGGYLFTDTQLDYYTPPPAPEPNVITPASKVARLHNDAFNALFADGHVKRVPYGSSKPAQWTIQAD